jgi:hypothetical protein
VSSDTDRLGEHVNRQLKLADLRVRTAERKVRRRSGRLEFDGFQTGDDGTIVLPFRGTWRRGPTSGCATSGRRRVTACRSSPASSIKRRRPFHRTSVSSRMSRTRAA